MNNPKRLLIVDDETEIVEILKHHFERKGFQVFTSSSGEEAIKLLPETSPDLILLDNTLKGTMNGTGVLKKMKEMNFNAKVIFCTGMLADNVKKEAEDLGVGIFLLKPFPMETLDEVVDKTLS